ncbi:Rhomboid family protein [Planctomycetes bacterium CA13]|uniref:Rhomboid family protein n=1 Tax=Novipirellula herctigrandis TaxID=2527986 RepID=A0A5C5Z8W1_9BACT|nr:Rhomboid family protein [Planctomycetes bacterium CA13]
MLFVPYSTDAPLYHWPIATGSIIAVNVIVFFATTFQAMCGNIEYESLHWLILEFNQINPFQWVSQAFMHADFSHLLGNMFFLWAFGVVVEGKIGGVVFTILYFAMTAIDGAMVQIPMFVLSGESGALGASGVIFALMMIALIWAPENEISCFYWFFRLVGSVDIRIITLAVTFVFMQVAFLFLNGFSMSSEMLHMIGAVIGTPVGFLMLRQGWVDCEGWDVVSRNPALLELPWLASDDQRRRVQTTDRTDDDPVERALALDGASKGRAGASANASPSKAPVRKPVVSTPRPVASAATKTPAKAKPAAEQTSMSNAAVPVIDVNAHPEFNRLSFTLRQSVDTENLVMAEQAFSRLEQLKLTPGLSERMLFRYVAMLGKQKKWVEAIRPLNLIANRNGALADESRIRIAQVQISVLKKPQLALVTLQQIDASPNQKPDILKKRQQLLASVQ